MTTTKMTILHTGTVIVDKALPYYRDTDPPLAWTHLLRPKSALVEIPVSCYLIENSHGLTLIDTGWHTDNRTRWGQIKNLRHQYPTNKANLPEGQAIHEQLEEHGIRPQDLDLVLMSHLYCDHADGLRLIKEAPRILVSEPELRAAQKDRIRYLPSQWKGVNLQTYGWNSRVGERQAYDPYGDGSVVMVSAPGHSPGLTATLVRGTDTVPNAEPGVIGNDLRKYILLTSNVGFGRPSFEERLRPGVVTDAKAAFSSLDWACAAGADPRCIAMYANHDPEVDPGTRVLS